MCVLQIHSTGFCKYVRNKWNIIDHTMYILLVVAFILRFALTNESDFQWARSVYAVALVMFYLRTLQLYLLYRPVGPKIVMIGRMVCGIISVAVLLWFTLFFSVA